ncbi:MAG TPA: U32 family peptidase [Alphaproteobacteria bacterium]|jgi:collagenase-like PrtC family protease|nr:U32 family peptidase [Alphaproteobacteria bacterium]
MAAGGAAAGLSSLSIGPVFFNWAPERWRDFHFRLADEAPVDRVHIGEVICSKRAGFFAPHIPDVVERLQRGGKQVVLSLPALNTLRRELDWLREMAASDDLTLEANDVSALALLAGRRHAVGPFVNVYNEGTLGVLAERGAVRLCPPPELSAEALGALAAGAPEGLSLEPLAFGRIPLAISARCYHARAHGRSKAACQYVCGEDPDGLAVETMDGAPFLAVNGLQTLSHACLALVGELGSCRDMGISQFRLSPQSCDMVAVAEIYRAVLDGAEPAERALKRLAALTPGMALCNGYFHGARGDAFCR